MIAYKFLTAENKGEYSEYDYTEWLPTGDEPGPWLPDVNTLEMCASGYHVTDKEHLLDWTNNELWEVEVDGEHLDGDDKSTWQRMRFVRRVDAWNDKTARLFSCWCVRQAWHLLTDERSRNAVEVAERYAVGEATDEELAAARDAAWAAARAAAGDAAWAAAWDAAWDASWAAAGDAQRKHLVEMLGL